MLDLRLFDDLQKATARSSNIHTEGEQCVDDTPDATAPARFFVLAMRQIFDRLRFLFNHERVSIA
jgi:hypothetical protein